ncbi:MAG: hypothetical protein V7L23_31740 [Nostoc sp.]|uniref:hypothetical protein n=1 Tax=Nostoc sp. TaxID=1180 RepID=UPI002FF214B7
MLKACACAGEQGSRGAGESSMCLVLCPPPLCPSAFQTCEKCGIHLRCPWGMVKSRNLDDSKVAVIAIRFG